MTEEQMAERLGISNDELEVMRAEKAAGTLKIDYPTLELHLGRMLFDKWAPRWAEVRRKLGRAHQGVEFDEEERRLKRLEEVIQELGL